MKRILLLSDSPSRGAELHDLLKSGDYEVGTASLPEGLDRVPDMEFDLAIVDALAPPLAGYEVCCYVKTLRSRPVLLVVTPDVPNDLLSGIGLGPDRHLTRPVSNADLQERIQQLLNDPEADATSPSKTERVEINQIITGADKTLRKLVGDGIVVQLRLDPEPAWVRAEAARIEQIMVALALNARNSMLAGGTMVVKTENLDLASSDAEGLGLIPGPHVSLTVTDTGLGMSESANPNRMAGLGLSTVQAILQQLTGCLQIKSHPGRGTSFRILLPCTEDDAPDEDPRDVTVLLVEDDPIVKKIAVTVLESVGYKVLAAANGMEGLHLCETYDGIIHVLVSDMVMPKMSGETLAARALSLRPTMRCVLMTGYVDVGSDLEPMKVKALMLQKPFKSETLLKIVQDAARHRTPAPGPSPDEAASLTQAP